MRILVTGCNGLIGRAAAEHLVRAGHDVSGTDIAPMAGRPHRVHVGDLRTPSEIHRAIDAAGWGGGVPDAIVHLANHRNADVAPAEVVLRENLAMNSSVFVGAKELGVKRIVFSSSVQAVLGGVEREVRSEGPILPVRVPIDESTPTRPANTYGLSKLLTEKMLDSLTTTIGPVGSPQFTAVSLRFPWVLAEKQFEIAVVKGRPTPDLWGLTEAFAYLHVLDAAESIRLAVEKPISGGAAHEVFWIIASDTRPVEPIAEIYERAYKDVPGATECIARGSFYDCSKAARILGWKPTRLLGIARAKHARGEAFT